MPSQKTVVPRAVAEEPKTGLLDRLRRKFDLIAPRRVVDGSAEPLASAPGGLVSREHPTSADTEAANQIRMRRRNEERAALRVKADALVVKWEAKLLAQWQEEDRLAAIETHHDLREPLPLGVAADTGTRSNNVLRLQAAQEQQQAATATWLSECLAPITEKALALETALAEWQSAAGPVVWTAAESRSDKPRKKRAQSIITLYEASRRALVTARAELETLVANATHSRMWPIPPSTADAREVQWQAAVHAIEQQEGVPDTLYEVTGALIRWMVNITAKRAARERAASATGPRKTSSAPSGGSAANAGHGGRAPLPPKGTKSQQRPGGVSISPTLV